MQQAVNNSRNGCTWGGRGQKEVFQKGCLGCASSPAEWHSCIIFLFPPLFSQSTRKSERKVKSKQKKRTDVTFSGHSPTFPPRPGDAILARSSTAWVCRSQSPSFGGDLRAYTVGTLPKPTAAHRRPPPPRPGTRPPEPRRQRDYSSQRAARGGACAVRRETAVCSPLRRSGAEEGGSG